MQEAPLMLKNKTARRIKDIPGFVFPDIKIHADHIVRIREKMNTLLSQYTGQPLDVITRDTERDNYMTAQQAKEYGLIDDILYKH